MPSDTENPKRDGKEHCKAITLRNRREIEQPIAKTNNKKEHSSIQGEVEKEARMLDQDKQSKAAKQDATASPQQSSLKKLIDKSLPSFPQRFQKQQQDKQFRRFLDVLKQLHINIPLVEALEQMSSYVKFLKDILSKKRRLGEFETIALTEESSAIFQNKILQG